MNVTGYNITDTSLIKNKLFRKTNNILYVIMYIVYIYSGLDSSSSTSLIALLNGLARGGRTLITTIHQPSALVFDKIDSIYCLTSGNTLYSGPRMHLLSSLNHAGLQCPPYHNPADFRKYYSSLLLSFKQSYEKILAFIYKTGLKQEAFNYIT